jgi:rhodanese-related sulfurtransferase
LLAMSEPGSTPGSGEPVAGGSAPVLIAPDLACVSVDTPNGTLEISRIGDPEHRLSAEWSKTSRPAPPALLQPLAPVDGVVPIGELELIEMLQRTDVVVADSRKPEQYLKYTIPGAISLPFTEIENNLHQLGCGRTEAGWDCSEARPVALLCNGAWCGQSPTAIGKMVAAGYPPRRIFYYRNGLQGWLLQGLSVWTPGEAETFHI